MPKPNASKPRSAKPHPRARSLAQHLQSDSPFINSRKTRRRMQKKRLRHRQALNLEACLNACPEETLHQNDNAYTASQAGLGTDPFPASGRQLSIQSSDSASSIDHDPFQKMAKTALAKEDDVSKALPLSHPPIACVELHLPTDDYPLNLMDFHIPSPILYHKRSREILMESPEERSSVFDKPICLGSDVTRRQPLPNGDEKFVAERLCFLPAALPLMGVRLLTELGMPFWKPDHCSCINLDESERVIESDQSKPAIRTATNYSRTPTHAAFTEDTRTKRQNVLQTAVDDAARRRMNTNTGLVFPIAPSPASTSLLTHVDELSDAAVLDPSSGYGFCTIYIRPEAEPTGLYSHSFGTGSNFTSDQIAQKDLNGDQTPTNGAQPFSAATQGRYLYCTDRENGGGEVETSRGSSLEILAPTSQESGAKVTVQDLATVAQGCLEDTRHSDPAGNLLVGMKRYDELKAETNQFDGTELPHFTHGDCLGTKSNDGQHVCGSLMGSVPTLDQLLSGDEGYFSSLDSPMHITPSEAEQSDDEWEDLDLDDVSDKEGAVGLWSMGY